MILVDTNIIIKYWKNPDSRITEVLEKKISQYVAL